MKLFTLLLCAIILAGCAPRYVMQVGSSTAKQTSQGFTTNKQNVVVRYDFWSYNGRLNLIITNKEDHPVYINWKDSYVSINGKQYSYYNEKMLSFQMIGTSDKHKSTFGYLYKIKAIKESLFKREVVEISGRKIRVNSVTFPDDDSPETFTNHIAYSADSSFNSEFVIEDKFSFTKLYKLSGRAFTYFISPDRFYLNQ